MTAWIQIDPENLVPIKDQIDALKLLEASPAGRQFFRRAVELAPSEGEWARLLLVLEDLCGGGER